MKKFEQGTVYKIDYLYCIFYLTLYKEVKTEITKGSKVGSKANSKITQL